MFTEVRWRVLVWNLVGNLRKFHGFLLNYLSFLKVGGWKRDWSWSSSRAGRKVREKQKLARHDDLLDFSEYSIKISFFCKIILAFTLHSRICISCHQKTQKWMSSFIYLFFNHFIILPATLIIFVVTLSEWLSIDRLTDFLKVWCVMQLPYYLFLSNQMIGENM